MPDRCQVDVGILDPATSGVMPNEPFEVPRHDYHLLHLEVLS